MLLLFELDNDLWQFSLRTANKLDTFTPPQVLMCGDCRWDVELLVPGFSAVAGRYPASYTGCLILLIRLRCEDDERGQPEEQSVHPHPQQTDPGAGFWQSCRWLAAVCCSGQHSQTHQVSPAGGEGGGQHFPAECLALCKRLDWIL